MLISGRYLEICSEYSLLYLEICSTYSYNYLPLQNYPTNSQNSELNMFLKEQFFTKNTYASKKIKT